jgi:hypothetical protein
MDQPDPLPAPRRLGILVAVISAIVTSLIGLYFRGMAESCVELGCLGLLLFYPASATGAALAALFVTGYAGRERAGCLAGLFWAAAGWLAGMLIVLASGMLRT